MSEEDRNFKEKSINTFKSIKSKITIQSNKSVEVNRYHIKSSNYSPAMKEDLKEENFKMPKLSPKFTNDNILKAKQNVFNIPEFSNDPKRTSSLSKQFLANEIAITDSASKPNKTQSIKSEKAQIEGYSLSNSPPFEKSVPIASKFSNKKSFGHSTIPSQQALINTYAKVFDITPEYGKTISEQKLSRKSKASALRKTTTLLQELENMQGQSSKQNEQNEFELGLVPIDIYATNEFETAEQIVEARGYVLQERLGSGAFANVYKAWHTTQQIYTACKVIEIKRKKRKRLNDLKHELYVLEKMDHSNIVKLYEHFLIDEKVYIFLEFAACGTVGDYVRKRGPLKESRCRKWFKQISSGNILIDEYRNLKISDFGLSRVSYRKGYGVFYCTSYAGTEPYMAVEIIKKNENGKRVYDPLTADIWSMGVCLYAMSNKAYPFNPEDKELMIANQLNRKWKFTKKQRGKLSNELKDLLKHLLEPDPKRRITFLGIATHPWLHMNSETNDLKQSSLMPQQQVSISTSTITQPDDAKYHKNLC